jgi:hypothetical protein
MSFAQGFEKVAFSTAPFKAVAKKIKKIPGALASAPEALAEGYGKVKGTVSGAQSGLKKRIEDLSTSMEHATTRGFNKVQGKPLPGAKRAEKFVATDPVAEADATKRIQAENSKRKAAGQAPLQSHEAIKLTEDTAKEYQDKYTKQFGKQEIQAARAKRAAKKKKDTPWAVKHPLLAGSGAAVLAHMAMSGGGEDQQPQTPPIVY